MRTIILLATLVSATALHAATTRNDDSCDIAVLPAATLLLPYFEVDVDEPGGETTLFTVTNVTNLERIAHVTLWTDRSYPVLDFNLYLTGYDVQAINLYDVLARGVIGSADFRPEGRGKFSDPNPTIDRSGCAALPDTVAAPDISRVLRAFLDGASDTCDAIGGRHERAVGYATIDVVRTCDSRTPDDPLYWREVAAFDNVLTGDYQQLNGRENMAQGGPLVHIRAIPEGGTARERRSHPSRWDAGFERTFYSRYQSPASPRLDGRQPLPSTFAARWISEPSAGFATSLKIWREGNTGPGAECSDYAREAKLDVAELVAFDESENAVSAGGGLLRELPATSRTAVTDTDVFPPVPAAPGGWMYLNLDESRRDGFASQGWVISSMRAEDRFSTDIDAVALATGCTSAVPVSEITTANGPSIAPATVEDSCDIALLPAATLLLPYFEVDLEDPAQERTVFTITNVSPVDRIARVTLWTDYSFPVITFSLFLTGYDVQSIDLFDVLAFGRIGPPDARGPFSDRNPALDRSDCANSARTLDFPWIERMQAAFTQGVVPDFGTVAGCNNVGNEHDNAVGYATIDVVRNCDETLPTASEYWSKDIAFDNVLIGDVQQRHSRSDFAQGSPMVHIRAVDKPARTFYEKYQQAPTARRDRRQPLPTTFAARWVQGGSSQLQTSVKIWRSAAFATPSCALLDNAGFDSLREIVRFDEAENAVSGHVVNRVTPITTEFRLPSTSLTAVQDDDVFPQLANGAIAGWAFFNLDSSDADDEARQGWVTVSMQADGRFSVDLDAAALGNGCSPAPALSEVSNKGTAVIGPAPEGRP
jgi:hypothetical protein